MGNRNNGTPTPMTLAQLASWLGNGKVKVKMVLGNLGNYQTRGTREVQVVNGQVVYPLNGHWLLVLPGDVLEFNGSAFEVVNNEC